VGRHRRRLAGDDRRWNPDRAKYPNGERMCAISSRTFRAAGLKPRLWYSPLSARAGIRPPARSRRHAAARQGRRGTENFLVEQLLPLPRLCKDGAAHAGVDKEIHRRVGICRTQDRRPAFEQCRTLLQSAHHHARPEESVEGLQALFRAVYQTATAIDPDAVIELCPCGTAYSAFNFPYMNQAPGPTRSPHGRCATRARH